MDEHLLLVIGAALLLFAALSKPFENTILTAPLAFLLLGFAAGDAGFALVEIEPEGRGFHLFAEFTLALILFSDASSIDLSGRWRELWLPARLLLIALPLVVGAGYGLGVLLFGGALPWAEIALIAAVLAPTDAALGYAVIASSDVPRPVRETINVESGLNDGLAFPAVLFFAAFASSGLGMTDGPSLGAADWAQFVFAQIWRGLAVGLALGFTAGGLVAAACAREFVAPAFQRLSAVAATVLALALAPLLGANAFVTAYVAGLVFGVLVAHGERFTDFAEIEGQLFSLLTFFIVGATLAPQALGAFEWTHLLYAALSLTLVRAIPVFIALTGSGLSVRDKLFVGWFGPRGLATVLFLLIVFEEGSFPHAETIKSIALTTVVLSVVLHGVTAAPLARLYRRA